MSVAIALLLAVLAIQPGLQSKQEMDVDKAEWMKQREEYLPQEVARLLEETERSGAATLLPVSQQWPFWISAGAVLLLAGAVLLLAVFCWLARNKQLASRGSSSVVEKDNKQEQEDPRGELSVARPLAVSTPSPVQGLPDICTVVKELVGDLLRVCQMLCRKTSMPQLHPVPGTDGTSGFWRVQENTITYTLPVFLQPPLGHSFRLQMDTTGQLPAGHRSVIHVVRECTCQRDQLLGNISCFLHHPTPGLPGDQSSDLLRTLCTRSCLDVKKIACWARLLVRSAWLFLPQSNHCQLTVLPSSHSCMFQLTGISEVNIFTEMIFGVQRGSSVTCLSQE